MSGANVAPNGAPERRATLRRAARREREAASALGSKRVLRSRYQSAPDCRAVVLPCGVVLGPEVKTAKNNPKRLTKALAQAQRYFPRAVPIVVFSETGGAALVCLDLRAFCRIAGIDAASLPSKPRRRSRDPRQLDLLPL